MSGNKGELEMEFSSKDIEKIMWWENLDQKTIDRIKIVLMFGLIITMAVLAVAIFKYGKLLTTNPCELCNCAAEFVKGNTPGLFITKP